MALLLRSSSFQQQKEESKRTFEAMSCRTTNDNARKMTPFEMMIELKEKKKTFFLFYEYEMAD